MTGSDDPKAREALRRPGFDKPAISAEVKIPQFTNFVRPWTAASRGHARGSIRLADGCETHLHDYQ